MMDSITAIIITLIGSNGIWAVVVCMLNRKGSTRSLIRAVSYHLLSSTIEKLLDQDYATPESRKDLEILFEAYKANGWNGDMRSRMQMVYELPTKKIDRKKSCV